jgi:tight adherence protein B
VRTSFDNIASPVIPQELHLKLASVNWPITAAEFVLIRFIITLFALAIGWLLSGFILIGLALAIAIYPLPKVIMARFINKRQKEFQDQLIDVLVLMAGSLQAGFSLRQAVDLIVDEMAPPSAEEFERVRREVDLGIPFSQALINLSRRMDSDDLYLVVTAININTQVGGSLSGMLDGVVKTIRDRMNLFGEIRVLTSYGRFAGQLLTILPFITGALMMLINPAFFAPLLEPGAGRIILVVALIFIFIGNVWIRQIVKIKV